MQWTKEKPKVEGVYWMRHTHRNSTIIECVNIIFYGNKWFYQPHGDDEDPYLPDNAYYYGPITPPEFKE